MTSRFQPALLLSILALGALAPAARAAETKEFGPPLVEYGLVQLAVGRQLTPISYSRTVAGPLFALSPLVARLGGELELGPLGQSHTLRIDEAEFRFGPDSQALTQGEEILALSQPPRIGEGGIQVPLDLLEATYSSSHGLDFIWRSQGRRLEVNQRPPGEVAVSVDVVRVQGVSTVVFQFSDRPRYRVVRRPGSVELQLTRDRLRYGRRPALPAGGLVRRLELGPRNIRLTLAPDAVAEDYTLEQPFRLVFDVYRGAAPAPAGEAAVIAPQPARQRGEGIRTIVIDPGHGGSNTGAEGLAGSLEKELTLQLARTLRSQLERRLPVRVVLTRNEDAQLPLDTRVAVANQQKADLFISLHLNASPGRAAQGAETYFLALVASDERAAEAALSENAGDPLSDLQLILWDLAQSHHMSESQRFAALIQEELNEALGLRNRGVKQAPFRVLMGAAMPAVLVELGFLSNPQEEERLNDPLYRSRLAGALVDAVTRYKAIRAGAELPTEETLR